MLVLLAAGVAQAQDSLNCRFVGNWPFGPSLAVALDSSRNLAFCGSGGGVYVLDVSDPALPVKRSEISTRGAVNGLCYLNNRLYVADGLAGLRIISVSDPANPVEVGFYDTPGYAYGVAVVGNYAYVADYFAGLRVISVSDPAHPTEVGFYETPGAANGVAVVGAMPMSRIGMPVCRSINSTAREWKKARRLTRDALRQSRPWCAGCCTCK
jgi:hypothetical protein